MGTTNQTQYQALLMPCTEINTKSPDRPAVNLVGNKAINN